LVESQEFRDAINNSFAAGRLQAHNAMDKGNRKCEINTDFDLVVDEECVEVVDCVEAVDCPVLLSSKNNVALSLGNSKWESLNLAIVTGKAGL
jgi:hypothetical protein